MGLGPSHIVLDWDPAALPKKRSGAPNFWLISIVAKRMPLGMEIGLSPGDFVLDGDPAPLPKKGAESPNFRPMSIVAKRLYVSGYHLVGGRYQSRRHCVR